MTFWQKLFGHRTTRCASGSASLVQAEQVALSTALLLASHTGYATNVHRVSNTNSMLPVLDNNAIILAEAAPFAALQEGDIVTYQAGAKLICHRLNERTARGWWPLGDGNASMDAALVTPENYRGRICGILYGQYSADTNN